MDYDDWYDGAMDDSYDDSNQGDSFHFDSGRGRGGGMGRRGGRGGMGRGGGGGGMGRGGGGGYFRNDRYSNAYGNYNGGYGPSGALGPPPGFGPPPCPPMVMYPPPMVPDYSSWGRGFGPEGPPSRKRVVEEKILRYLKRCGVPKELMKNLPFSLLKLYEAQQCGLCGHTFESFSSSRLHYQSKNHAKNQKKWLLKKSEGGQRHKEIPVKSRELYCELCDVHITSKTHADSHYAGKPHRSIVEGRKNPKNPMLLQKGMRDRLLLLIRREKKFLKPLEDTQEADKTADPSKPVQPEFYCEICKTAVTCSEQMTMHLNGKRHLTKEKSHILRMMKGSVSESANEATEEPAEGDAEGEGDEEDEEEEEKKEEVSEPAGDDKYDWGNGSGNWEESTTE